MSLQIIVHRDRKEIIVQIPEISTRFRAKSPIEKRVSFLCNH